MKWKQPKEWPMVKIPFRIEQNENGTYAIIENPDVYRLVGSIPWYNERVVRSPFSTKEEARQRIKDIGKHYEYEPFEIE